MKIAMAVQPHGYDDWAPLMPIGEHDPSGSMSSEPPDGPRDVIIFGWMQGAPGVWRSKGGADIELGALRATYTAGLELLSDLSEPFEIPIVRPSIGLIRVRFALEKDDA